jgi:hypothetical protein
MRYSNNRTIKNGTTKATSKAAIRLRSAYNAGRITTTIIVIGRVLRLDHVAFQYLGDPGMWWAIAALSDIGWGLQLPPGTRLVVPTDASQIEGLF